MPSGFAVMSETQFLPGYCLLLAYPEVNHLTDLDDAGRAQYLLDMAKLGEAVMAVTQCRRINYSILGNLDPFLHTHVFPRYESEEMPLKVSPPTDYPAEYRNRADFAYDPAVHGEIQEKIRAALETG